MIIKSCDFCKNTDQNQVMYEVTPVNDYNGYGVKKHICLECLKKFKESKEDKR